MSGPSKDYMKVWNRWRREYKKIWMWNKRHPHNQKELPKPPKPKITKEVLAQMVKEIPDKELRYGNDLWKVLVKEDIEWRKLNNKK